ncbi:MAG: cryptochrome/photolyase family protein [Oceanococcaceae bacterium]
MQLIIVLGDQLDLRSVLPEDYVRGRDLLWMCEHAMESTDPPSHKARTVMFLAAMRHFAAQCRDAGHRVHYHHLDATPAATSLSTQLQEDLAMLTPRQVVLTTPGDMRLTTELHAAIDASGVPLRQRDDPHFFCTPAEYAQWADGRKMVRMEHFYRHMRRRHDVLIDRHGEPVGGQWNFDASNREPLPRDGLRPPAPVAFPPDAITRDVIALINRRFPEHPGSTDDFDWPISAAQARAALADFIEHRLPHFGHYQDAMQLHTPWLYHSRLSAAMNLHLLNPREVVDAAIEALNCGHAPLNAVEGFIRQILGWREFVRGLYFQHMPGWEQENALEADADLPAFFWTGETEFACLADAIGQTLRYGYAHHIQRLMVTGLFCLLLGVTPRAVHRWYLGVYVDAVEWVELPNTLGMSQYVDNGRLASKPYIASGNYIQRMSDSCRSCPRDPRARTGPRACPFTTLYWDFLDRQRARFKGHPRLTMQLRNLERLDNEAVAAIRQEAQSLRERLHA